MTISERIVRTTSQQLLPGMTCLDEWQLRMQATLNFATCFSKEQVARLAWDVTTHHFAGLIGVVMHLSPQRILRQAASLSQGDMDYLMVDLVLNGELLCVTPFGEVTACSGDILLLDLLQESSVCIERPASILSWILPRAAWLEEPSALHGQVIDHRQPAARLLGVHLKELIACSDTLHANDVVFYGEESTHLLVRALSQTLGSGTQHEKEHPLLGRLCLYIERHLHDRSLSPLALSQRFGLARASLYRLFEPMGGVAGYIRKRRLIRARRYLLEPRYRHLRISQVADQCGLEAASFSRLFVQAFGLPPRQVRELCLSAKTLPFEEEADIQRAHLGWFRQL
ncbi:AraC family transcriptional regulator [Halomonas sp. CnH100-B]|uniref:helix-turn-helix domain-containing protein n=1 Tax=Halomonas sp. CnH100-B TaxID=2954490 RepID=UPI002096BC2A|nr:AraC family transcriptional regulator [Halomonas sp. CnH100-B]